MVLEKEKNGAEPSGEKERDVFLQELVKVTKAPTRASPYGGGPDGQSPIFVRKGEIVNYAVYTMHRRKDLWGPDAKMFDPDRWYGRKANWEYLPFNGGPRICLGQQFALAEAGYVLTWLIQKFDRIESCDSVEEALYQYSVTSALKRVLVPLHEDKKT